MPSKWKQDHPTFEGSVYVSLFYIMKLHTTSKLSRIDISATADRNNVILTAIKECLCDVVMTSSRQARLDAASSWSTWRYFDVLYCEKATYIRRCNVNVMTASSTRMFVVCRCEKALYRHRCNASLMTHCIDIYDNLRVSSLMAYCSSVTGLLNRRRRNR